MAGEARIARVKQKAKAVFPYAHMAIAGGVKRLRVLKARDIAKMGAIFALACLLVILPFLQSGTVLGVATHTWTTNADFLRNKAGTCSKTTIDGLTVSGTEYTDDTCYSPDEDVDLRLNKGVDVLNAVQVSAGYDHSLALKNDGTVWAWGNGAGGVLGDDSTVNRDRPVQVLNPDGTGFLTNVKAIAAGYNHSLALKNDGTVWAWGNGGNGQLGNGTSSTRTRPVQVHNPDGSGFLTDVKAIAASSNYHSLALKNDGTVWAWGYGASGQLGNGTTASQTRPVQVHNPDGSGFLTDVKDIAAGSSYSLALKNDGTVWAWGSKSNSALGNDAANTQQIRPIQVLNTDGSGFLTDVKAITAGYNHVLALKNDGTVWAWGNGSSAIGNGATSTQTRPVQVHNPDGSGFLMNVKAIAAGNYRSLALKNDGTVWAWGNGRLGNGTTASQTRPVQVHNPDGSGFLTDVKAIATGDDNGFAIQESGTISGWGANDAFKTVTYSKGVTTSAISRPINIAERVSTGALSNITKIIGGYTHILALKNDGTVWAWGNGGSGRLGNGASTSQYLPVQVHNPDGSGFLTDVKDIAAGSSYSLALKNDGTVWAWGYGVNLGNGTTTTNSQVRPVQVHNSDGSGFLTDVKAITASDSSSLALKNDGTVWAWGNSGSGVVGNGVVAGPSYYYRPIQVLDPDGSGFLTNVKDISAGFQHVLALKNDGTVWAWGRGSNGQLGNGLTTAQYLPVQVKNPDGTGFLTNVKAIAAGYNHSLALKNDGTVWAWGNGGNGALGNGAAAATRSLPVQVQNPDGSGFLTGVTAIKGGTDHSLALKNDGTVWAWGNGGNGQLGNGSTATQYLPVQVQNPDGSGFLTGVTAIGRGGNNGFAIKNDGTAWAWGYGSYGELSNDLVVTQTTRPTNILEYVSSLSDHYTREGTLYGAIIDVGAYHQTKWYQINWNTDALPNNTNISFSVRTSQDKSNWSSWSEEFKQSSSGSISGNASIESLPYSRFLEVRVKMNSSNGVETPVLNSFSIVRMNDVNPPEWDYPEAIPVWTDDSKSTLLTSDSWERRNNRTSVYADWSGATEPEGESGISNYYVYFGPDNTADPVTAGVDKGLTTEGSLDLPNNPSDQTYYIRVSVKDTAGNVLAVPAGESLFKYRFDQTQPLNPTYVSVSPFGWATTNDFTFTWPSGVVDPGSGASGVTGFQYKRGGDTEWSETQTGNSVSSIQAYQDGKNEFLVRSVDASGNVAEEYTSVNYYYNGSAPRPPENLQATPASSTLNRFTFTWDEPDSGNGVKGYYYSVNAQPTANNSVFTTELSTGAIPAATQQGFNTLYVVAIDNSDQINWGNYASVQFEANTAAPGVPGGLVISDSSNRVDENWALTLNWSAAAGAVHRYHIYRSSDGVNFAKVAETSSVGYLDSGLSSMSTYYYKVQAVDNAGSTGIFSSVVSRQPTGKFTEPPLIVSGPTVKVSATSAVVTWVTNRPSSSFVSYSKDESFSESKGQLDNTTQHEVVLSGLESAMNYNFKVQSLDEDRDYATSDAFSSAHRLMTDVAPAISEVSVSDISLHSALVSWKTTTVSNSRIQYGTTTQYGQQIENESTSGTTLHTMRLTNLSDSTSYNFKIDGTDTDGNILTSDNYTFATLTYPRIFNVRFEGQSDTPGSTLKVTWESNVPTTSSVQYFEGSSKQQREVSETKLKTKHSMLVAGLKDDTVYRMIAQGRDAHGNLAVSDSNTVRTDYDTRPPVISNMTVETTIRGSGTEARGQIVVSWSTDEPATSQVAYGQGSGLETLSARTAEDEALSTEHVVIISDLPTSQVYTVQPISHDKAKNYAEGETRNAIVGRASDSVLVLIVNVFKKVFGW